jgi:hypothetical protein
MEDLSKIYNQPRYKNLILFRCDLCNLKAEKHIIDLHCKNRMCEKKLYYNICIYCGYILNNRCKQNHLETCSNFKLIYINNINNIVFLKKNIIKINICEIEEDGFNINQYRLELFRIKILNDISNY